MAMLVESNRTKEEISKMFAPALQMCTYTDTGSRALDPAEDNSRKNMPEKISLRLPPNLGL
jgi:hypothetical protein